MPAKEKGREAKRAGAVGGGAPHWITLLKMQIQPNVLAAWLHLYMVALVFGGGPLLSFLNYCLQSLSVNVSLSSS